MWVVPVIGAALAIAAGIVVAPVAALAVGAYAACAVAITNTQRRAGAVRALEALPFPVNHAPAHAKDADREGRPVLAATVRLAVRLDGDAAERSCRAATEAAPGLDVAVDDGAGASVITLTTWRWGRHDLVLLAHVLSGWAAGLHAEHGIVGVDVEWERRVGPRASI